MASTLTELPVIPLDQHAFNLKRWEEICADETLAAYDFRIETDEFGHTIMSPPAQYDHAASQGRLIRLLCQHAPEGGLAMPECPISTSRGIKVADAVWVSQERHLTQAGKKAVTVAPEICIEVLSPSNTRNEIAEKRFLFFEAGAKEVWICGMGGEIDFFLADTPETAKFSEICPNFPEKMT